MSIKLLAGLTVSGTLAFTVLAQPVVWAQQKHPPLAEVARKEAERRKTAKEAKKVITTKDLPESARRARTTEGTHDGGTAHGAGDQHTAGAQGADAQKPAAAAPSGDAAQGETYWRGRITQAREALRRGEVFAEALQSRINALTTDFVNRDNPIQRQQIGEDRQKALDELARVKSDIETSRKAIADIEEEARKSGVPPGWLR